MELKVSKIDGNSSISDVTELVNLHRNFLGDGNLSRKEVLESLIGENTFEFVEYFIAKDGEIPVGYILYSMKYFSKSAGLVLNTINLSPDYDDKGLCVKISNESYKILYNEGYKQVETSEFALLGEDELNFIRSLGFTLIREPMSIGVHGEIDLTKLPTSTSSPSSTSQV